MGAGGPLSGRAGPGRAGIGEVVHRSDSVKAAGDGPGRTHAGHWAAAVHGGRGAAGGGGGRGGGQLLG